MSAFITLSRGLTPTTCAFAAFSYARGAPPPLALARASRSLGPRALAARRWLRRLSAQSAFRGASYISFTHAEITSPRLGRLGRLRAVLRLGKRAHART